MSALGSRLLLPGAVVCIAALLLLPSADPARLELRATGRLLDREAEGLMEQIHYLAGLRGQLALRLPAELPPELHRDYRNVVAAWLATRDFTLDEASPISFGLALHPSPGSMTVVANLKYGANERELRLGPEPLRGRGALLPPLFAIGLAVLWRRTIPALLAGIAIGSVLLRTEAGFGPLSALALGVVDVPWVHLRRELFDTFRIEVIGFIVALMGMVGVMSRSGGVAGMVALVLRFAHTVRSTLLSAFGMGLLLFFDDYSNCLIVGNTMRPITDRLRISREKLAFIVDSTAAPVAGVSLLSTWVAFEISTFGAQLPAAGVAEDAYTVFLLSLPFRFYCWFTLLLVFCVILTGRDFGPMLGAERRARRTGALVRPGGRPLVSEAGTAIEPAASVEPRARRAIVPIATVVLVTIFEIFRRGGGLELVALDPAALLGVAGWTRILLEGGGAGPLFAGALAGLAVAALLSRLRPSEVARAAAGSASALGFAVGILFCAWMIGSICEQIGTADYLIALTQGSLPPSLLPVLLFGAACLVSFATGTSWGTMSILLPNVVVLAATVGADHPIGSFGMLLVCIGAVLEGSIFGDHCSPISDTTVLASVASASDHVDHVRTQAPYALLSAAAAVGLGYVPSVWLPEWSLAYGAALAIGLFLATLFVFGGRADDPSEEH